MKQIVRAGLLAIAAIFSSQAQAAPEGGATLRCFDLGEFIDVRVVQGPAADCTCDGPVMVEVGPIRVGGGGGGNGGVRPDCFFSTIVYPAYRDIVPGGPFDFETVGLPVRTVLRQCSTRDCYWIGGSATCEVEREYVSGTVDGFRIVGACTPDPKPMTP